ncbi:outer membrane beta-barrel domain-containing protein [Permianibacter sp. IMCC34836]|uniref:outer membrane beta-barrel domain-containing protein n=1 Tax=Permianibacter fluminis TaxID=2738515 RepID=UPI0015545D3F|nr:outer membrane beta-barrel domain-containing protein [Permianibacter fluminis]NQD37273.1 outer membrane beta-barrel domain-containing protein [Permianibacter fluminis]
MESRIQPLFLSTLRLAGVCFALGFGAQAAAADADNEPVYDPEVERRAIDEDLIDVNDIEIGLTFGVLSIEDFGSNSVVGAKLTYHISEDFFFTANFAQSEAGQTSYERLSGGASLLTDDQRQYEYYGLNLGYNLFPGEAFIGEGHAINTSFYLLAGVGSTSFAEDDYFTWHLGAGYRFVPWDWLAVSIDFQDHIFEHEILGETIQSHNLEFSTGITVFF